MSVGYNGNPSPQFAVPALNRATGEADVAQAAGVVLVDSVTGLPVARAAGYAASTHTRPENATPYTGGDVVGATAAALSFPNMGLSGSSILITSASLEVQVSAIPSGMTSFRLHLYTVTPPSALADNAVWDLPSGDRASYVGFIDLGSPVDMGSTLYVEASQINKQVKLTGTGLFGYLVTNGGYTPTSAAVKVVKVHAVGV